MTIGVAYSDVYLLPGGETNGADIPMKTRDELEFAILLQYRPCFFIPALFTLRWLGGGRLPRDGPAPRGGKCGDGSCVFGNASRARKSPRHNGARLVRALGAQGRQPSCGQGIAHAARPCRRKASG